MSYTVVGGLNGAELQQITRDDGVAIRWADPDFQTWNAAQSTPFQLSVAQQAIANAKGMTFNNFVTFVTNQYAALNPPQQPPPQAILRLWFELLQRALKGEIV